MIITIFGKSASGKSSIATNLSCALASFGAKVALFSTDLSYPSLQLYFNLPEFNKEYSLGAFFEKCDFGNLEKYFIPVKDIKNIYVAGPHYNDYSHKYKAPSRDLALEFLEKVNSIFDFVIVESTGNKDNSFSLLSLIVANYLIDVMKIDIQNISYKTAYEPLIAALFKGSKIIRVANNVNSYDLIKEVEETLGFKFECIFPKNNIVEESSETFVPAYYSLGGKDLKSYITEINSLAEKLFKEKG